AKIGWMSRWKSTGRAAAGGSLPASSLALSSALVRTAGHNAITPRRRSRFMIDGYSGGTGRAGGRDFEGMAARPDIPAGHVASSTVYHHTRRPGRRNFEFFKTTI